MKYIKRIWKEAASSNKMKAGKNIYVEIELLEAYFLENEEHSPANEKLQITLITRDRAIYESKKEGSFVSILGKDQEYPLYRMVKFFDIENIQNERTAFLNYLSLDENYSVIYELLLPIVVHIGKKVLSEDCYELFQNLLNRCKYSNEFIKIKTLKYLLFEPVVFEKMLKSLNLDMLISELSSNQEIMEDQGKLHQTIGVPKKALKLIQEMKLEQAMPSLRSIAEVNQSYPEFLLESIKLFESFLEKLKINYKDAGRYYYNRNTIFSRVKFIQSVDKLVNKGYAMKPLINYLLKQTLVYREGNLSHNSLVNMNHIQNIDQTASNLLDYIEMGEKMGLKVEKYPSILNKTHNIFVKNYKLVGNKELDDKMIEVAKQREFLEFEHEDWAFVVPKTLKDLAIEGNTLHHCVSSYGEKIVKGGVIVVFFRHKDKKDTPFITLELLKIQATETYAIVQAKGLYHEDPDKDTYKLINKTLKAFNKKITKDK